MFSFLFAKPVLIGFHLGFAILGIDAFLWLLSELRHDERRRARWIALLGTFGFFASWIAGGFYYVRYYGTLVKPIIKEGIAPWAHTIMMETKEHIFLFIIPVALTVFFITLLNSETKQRLGIGRITKILTLTVALIGLLIGLLGFIVSAAARWGGSS